MNGKTHAGISALVYLTACEKFPCRFSYTGLAVAVLVSLLPDIDHPKSIFNRHLFFIKSRMAMLVFYICLGVMTLWYDFNYTNNSVIKLAGATFIVVAISTHRNGLTHSLIGMAVFTSIGSYIAKFYKVNYISYVFMLAYGSHLLCDMATNRGVPLFYPFTKKKYKLPITYRVGSKTGNFIEKIIMICGLLYMIYILPHLLNFN